MNYNESVDQICKFVNERLSGGKLTFDILTGAIHGDVDRDLLNHIYQNYLAADSPDHFFSGKVTQADEFFEQCYEIFRISFDRAKRDSRENYIAAFQSEYTESTLILIGRFWKVLGLQHYDARGRLNHFSFDPLTTTENIVGAIGGNYMTIQSPNAPRQGMGAIGHLAVREAFRRQKGHGTALVDTFEQEVAAAARARNEELQVIVLEAETASWGFWYKRGYRWPVGTKYVQPPIDFDPLTGERRQDEVPELLMVKVWGHSDATEIDKALLNDAVHTMYQNWYLPQPDSPQAAQKVTDYIFGKLFTQFVSSLPSDRETVVIGKPPEA